MWMDLVFGIVAPTILSAAAMSPAIAAPLGGMLISEKRAAMPPVQFELVTSIRGRGSYSQRHDSPPRRHQHR